MKAWERIVVFAAAAGFVAGRGGSWPAPDASKGVVVWRHEP